ncbi:MAG: single-stranded DNA-binding protein [Deltaproteobacteria bacterium CG11_big_fil_rev_8_21_14_0_20_47_16]|nr:MAG: single-stranded DNA-binding protein [Deltaproteobacteria bacterium CG11_big_fil_rev_8_21_14_0_20_47_16]
MASLNRVMLIGNLGADPEVRYTPGGQPVATFNIATTERWTDKGGQKQEKTEWHRIVVWGKQAENCKEYLSKGRPVFIEGRLQTREWNDKEGKKRWTTEVVASLVQFLGTRSGSDRPSSGADAGPSMSAGADNVPGFDVNEDVPF